MVGGLGILFLCYICIVYIGSIIKNNNDNSSSKRQSQRKGWNVWYDDKCRTRNITDDHIVRTIRDEKYGLMRKDLETGKVYYDTVNDLIKRFNMGQLTPNYEDNMYKEQLKPNGRVVFTDCNNGRLLVLTCAKAAGDMNLNYEGKDTTWFYADFWDNTPVRKTCTQLKRDEELKKQGKNNRIYTMDDLRNFKDRGFICKDRNGDWKAYRSEIR